MLRKHPSHPFKAIFVSLAACGAALQTIVVQREQCPASQAIFFSSHNPQNFVITIANSITDILRNYGAPLGGTLITITIVTVN
jgi:hypothetical protein